MSENQVHFFACAADFRSWLAEHGASRNELLVGYWKVGSGKPSLTWPESVDEALCFGWIDGVRRRIDDLAYSIRFTPRRKDSIWSAVNIARAQVLIAAGRMEPAGLAAFAARTDQRSGVYSHEQRTHPELTSEETEMFKSNEVAWTFFESCPPSYRKPVLYWVVSAKRPETRARRLAELVAACARRERLVK